MFSEKFRADVSVKPVPHALYWVLAAGAGIVAVTIVLSFAITWSTRRARYMVLDGGDSG